MAQWHSGRMVNRYQDELKQAVRSLRIGTASQALKMKAAGFAVLVFIFVLQMMIPGSSLRQGTFRQKERFAHQLEQSKGFRVAVLATHAGSAASYARAQQYYEEQLPEFRAASSTFHLHQYWQDVGSGITSLTMGWYDLIGSRIHGMARKYRADTKFDDFKVEKDKCVMYDFLTLNKLPICPLIEKWDTLEGFVADLRSGALARKVSSWPVFLKTCHLTQGSSASTRPLFKKETEGAAADVLATWLASKWTYRADDWERPWRKDGNLLTDHLTPGIIIQKPSVLSFNPELGKPQVAEIKVEVFWGRAYAGVITDIKNWGHGASVATRGIRAQGHDERGVIEGFPDAFQHFVLSTDYLPKTGTGAWYNWIIEQDHLRKCAWPLAERAARIMGIDAVRIDIFMVVDQPLNCVINENSLSDGMGYGHHMEFMSKLWAEPHVTKTYTPYSNAKRIYEQTVADVPGPVPDMPTG
eukprot:m.324736 g.324736  ORF g.324736 m.324736 type:complete len:469 (+) comp27634_c1_seq4:285-1691(+)